MSHSSAHGRKHFRRWLMPTLQHLKPHPRANERVTSRAGLAWVCVDFVWAPAILGRRTIDINKAFASGPGVLSSHPRCLLAGSERPPTAPSSVARIPVR